jgi:hypothetical protein
MTFVLLVLAVIGAGWCYYFGRYYLDEWKMKDIAGSAATSWANLGEQRGRDKLEEEMRRREISGYLTKEQCTFYEDPGGVKVVDCSWFVDVILPFTDSARRLRFKVTKAADADGRLEDRSK